jgi:hypothetical protein
MCKQNLLDGDTVGLTLFVTMNTDLNINELIFFFFFIKFKVFEPNVNLVIPQLGHNMVR